MGVMMLAAGIGSEVELEAERRGREGCAGAIVALFNDKFGEGQ